MWGDYKKALHLREEDNSQQEREPIDNHNQDIEEESDYWAFWDENDNRDD